MELRLTLLNRTQVQVECNGHFSHSFELSALIPDPGVEGSPPHPLADPAAYGDAVYAALFPRESPASLTLDSRPERLVLILDDKLDVIPWEYVHGSDGFLVLELPFVRSLPPEICSPAPDLSSTPLNIIAVPSNPISRAVDPLNIEGEWQRLYEVVTKLSHRVVLQRTRPPTIDQVRQLALEYKHSVIHFMGHGGQQEEQSVLLFENEHGGLQPIKARDFVLSVRKHLFLATLNACVSATPNETEFSNLARSLVENGVPYALGMRFSIPDADALIFSRTFYSNLANGVDVEESLFQARRSLMRDNSHAWMVGVPVLYTSLREPAGGFARVAGKPQVLEHQPPLEVFVLPKAKGAFQGRVGELLALGKALTGEPRARLLTIHGTGGQGKTALAREAAERFAHAWPGGVIAISLETKPSRATFCFQLAQFLGLPTDQFVEPADLERAILNRLQQQRTLIVLDNAETFTEAVRGMDPDALDLADFLRERLLGTPSSLLVTSREPLGWPREQVLFLEGLSPQEGAALFIQSASGRQSDIQMEQAEALSVRLDGHPLALLLLGLAFNETSISLEQFMTEHQARLLQAEDRYKAEDHRHRTLYASIETSVRYLDKSQKETLSCLWIFQAPFLPETAAELFTMEGYSEEESQLQQKRIAEQLYNLSRRGLLVREVETLADGNILLYRTLPTVRLFAQHYIEQSMTIDELQARLGSIQADLLRNIDRALDSSSWASYLAVRCRVDLEVSLAWVEAKEHGWYANRLGWVLQRVGDRQAGMRYLERALEEAQGSDQELELHVLNNMGLVYKSTGQPGKALELYEQALPIRREVGDRDGEAATLGNMGMVYQSTGQPGKALELYEQALPIRREVGDRAGEATTLNNMAGVYQSTGQPGKALELFEQALPIRREVGDRAGEAATLNNMAGVYDATGQPGKALELYEQALPVMREVGDRAGEAAILNNMGAVYKFTGQPGKALELYEQALPIRREVGDRAGEATTLNNMGMVYRATGQPGKALELYEQALPIVREVGDRAGEAATLNNMAGVYDATRQPGKALKLYEQALPIRREVGDRAGEAATLNNMAGVYQSAGQPGKALELFEQALPIVREVGDRAGEAAILNNMGLVYRATGQPGKALELYEQALPIRREVGDRAGEATTLNNMAGVYQSTGQPGKALELYEQALPIVREVGDRAGEAITLNNMGMVYRATGQPGKALELFEQALPIRREVGDRAGEATTLSNMGMVYRATGQPGKALKLYEQALPILREVGDRAGEAITSFNMAMLARDLGQPQRALELLRQAVLLEKQVQHPDYPQDAALLAEWEASFRSGEPLPGSSTTDTPTASGLSAEQVQTIQHNTLAVLREVPEKHGEWRQVITQVLSQAQTATAQTEIEFFTAILTILDGKAPEIPPENPYAAAIHDLSRQLTQSGQTRNLPEDAPLPMDLPSDFVVRCVAGVSGSLEEKEALFEYLRQVNRKTSSQEVSILIKNIQLMLWNKNPYSLNPALSEPYAAVWQQIITHIS